MAQMQTRMLGRTGFSVSPLGLSSAPVGLLETEPGRVGTILEELLDAGVNPIDTAAAYISGG